MERRNLLAIAGAIVFGAPVLGEPTALTVRRVLTEASERVGASDMTVYEQTVARLEVLDRLSARTYLIVIGDTLKRRTKSEP